MEIKGVVVILLSVIAAVTIAFMFLRKKNRATSSTDVESTTNVTNKTSLARKRAYDVFLSFCGEDTRNQFTDFLYTFLSNASIKTFRDNEELRVGKEIGPGVLKAIKESKISIPILSKNYASSKWCLLELAEMVDCHTNGEHMIYPIFYDVNPIDVRNQRGTYELAFHEHEKKYDNETVRRWMDALKIVGELKGLELKKETNGREGELVKMVTQKVLVTLKKNYTILPKNLVGIDKPVEKLKAHLELDSGGVDALHYLHVSGGSMKRLQVLSCLRSLRNIHITNASELITIEDVGELEYLETLAISHCKSFKILLFSSSFRKLQYLLVEHCENLTGIQGLDRMESLKVINISDCQSLERFHGHGTNQSLERMVIERCWNLREIVGLQSFKNLKILGMNFLGNLTKIVGLQEVESLEYLVCDGCNSITIFPDLTKLKKLRMLCVVDCVKLIDFKGLKGLKSLEYLILTECNGLEDLSYLQNAKVLRVLSSRVLHSRMSQFLGGWGHLEYGQTEWADLTGSKLSDFMDALWEDFRTERRMQSYI